MFCSLLLTLSATSAKRINRGPESVPDTHDRDIIIIITYYYCLVRRANLIFHSVAARWSVGHLVFGFHRKLLSLFVLEKRFKNVQ